MSGVDDRGAVDRDGRPEQAAVHMFAVVPLVAMCSEPLRLEPASPVERPP